MIGITQPRRVAAISMASRVAYELSLTASKVSYQIRYDGTTSPDTAIKFMTDGVLLRELATDFLLLKYSIIIIDEAHERTLRTDLLIANLKTVLKVRNGPATTKGKEPALSPLKVVIMSATLDAEKFSVFYDKCVSYLIKVAAELIPAQRESGLCKRAAASSHCLSHCDWPV